MIFIKKYYLKNSAFSLFETIFILIFISIFFNLSYLRFSSFKETLSIKEAKLKINNAFSQTAITSLKTHEQIKLNFDFINKKIFIYKKNGKKDKIFSLPKNLHYYQTLSKNASLLNLNFTEKGNISDSFSIYIFNKKNLVKYKIAFYGFNEYKFLKINNYKKKENSKVYLNEIYEYHHLTNKDREKFYLEWKKE